MTELLKEAIAKVVRLPESEQDAAAEVLLAVVARNSGPVCLDDETRAAVREGNRQADRGEFAEDEDVTAFFRHDGT